MNLGSANYDKVKWISGSDKAGFSELEDEIALADFEFHLDGDEMLIPADKPEAKGFALPRLTSIPRVGHRQFPGFVVVQLHKLAQIDDVDDRVARINEYFFSRGSERVLVTGFLGFGRSIYSDAMNRRIQKSETQQRRAIDELLVVSCWGEIWEVELAVTDLL